MFPFDISTAYESTRTNKGYIKYSTELRVNIMIIIITSPYWQSDQIAVL